EILYTNGLQKTDTTGLENYKAATDKCCGFFSCHGWIRTTVERFADASLSPQPHDLGYKYSKLY
ncbi:MAG: hypothetical protein RL372_876, partial [Bacteroidota bacterium]